MNMWIALAFIFSNLFGFIMGYILMSAFVYVTDKWKKEKKEKQED